MLHANPIFQNAGFSGGITPGLQTSMQNHILQFANMSQAQIRRAAMTVVPEHVYRDLEGAVIAVAFDGMPTIEYMRGENLRRTIGNPLGVGSIYDEKVSASGNVRRQMVIDPDAISAGLPAREGVDTPAYATYDGFSHGTRELSIATQNGTTLDVTGVQNCQRNVNYALEDSLINGAGVKFGTADTLGLTTAPDRNTVTLANTWDDAATTGANIHSDFTNLVKASVAAKYRGPFVLIVNEDYGVKLNEPFDAANTSGRTIREVIEASIYGNQTTDIVISPALADDTVILMQRTNTVAYIAEGVETTLLPWQHPSGLILYFLVWTITVPVVRSDYDNQSGITVGTTA